jgi:hypothetical protein
VTSASLDAALFRVATQGCGPYNVALYVYLETH